MKRKLNRSNGANVILFVLLGIMALFMVIPLVYTVSNAFKPMDEFFIFPPKLFVRHPTLTNFTDLAAVMASSWVPLSRYFFNSIVIVLLGTGGHVILASMAAYPLAKHRFPGSRMLFGLAVLALMFAPEVTAIPNFLIMNRLGLLNSYTSLIIPAIVYPLGLFLMKQFMENVPDAILESARVEGAGEFRILWTIVMPQVRPAWLTLLLFNFTFTWTTVSSGLGSVYIFDEAIKPLPYMLSQITTGNNVAWRGIVAAVYFILIIVPVVVFLLTQKRVIETMSASGIKE